MSTLTFADVIKKFSGGLKQKAFQSVNSRGRQNLHKDDDNAFLSVIDPFSIDLTKISQAKGIRRLPYKTQVFFSPLNPHIRTRYVHTMEVFSISTLISEILGLNTHLCQAIAMAHDIGHVPYGHQGESFLSKVTDKDFRHEIFGVALLQRIERKGKGLNLSFEVLEGIVNHSRGDKELTVDNNLPLEYAVVMYADKISYLFADLNDAERYDLINLDLDIQYYNAPPFFQQLGQTQRERTFACVSALIQESCEKNTVSFSDSKTAKMFTEIKAWTYKNIYYKLKRGLEAEALRATYEFLQEFYDENAPLVLALMTDTEVKHLTELIMKSSKITRDKLSDFGFNEILPHLKSGVDYFSWNPW